MGVPFIEIYQTKAGERISSLINIGLFEWKIKRGLEAKQSTLEISIIHPEGEYLVAGTFQFDLDDTIEVYASWNAFIRGTDGKPTPDYLIIIATVSEFETTVDDTGKRIFKIKGVDKTYLMLSSAWSYSYRKAIGKDSSEIIKDVISHTTTDPVTGIPKITTNNVATHKSDGSAFPSVDIALVWKTIYEWIGELSQPEHTGEDRAYFFFVDKNNDLHWFYPFQKPSTLLSANINEIATTIPVVSTSGYPIQGYMQIGSEVIFYGSKTATSFTSCIRGVYGTDPSAHLALATVTASILREGQNEIFSINLSKNFGDVINFVIYNAGPTPARFELLWYYFDQTTLEKEFRMRVFDWKDIGLNLIARELRRDAWTNKEASYPPSYPWTTDWGVTVGSHAAYRSAFIAEQKRLGAARAQNMVQKSTAKFEGTIDMRGTMIYDPGEFLIINSPSHGILNIKMRIHDIIHSISSRGWFTSLELKEDPDPMIL